MSNAAHRRRSRRGATWLASLGALAAILGLLGAVPLLLGSNPARSSTPTVPVRPHYFDWHGAPPLGITLSGLQDYLITPPVITMMDRQMHAARFFWHANTIRLQILQDRLVGADGRQFRPAYMADIRQAVTYGLHLGMTVVLNAQTEVSTGYARSEPLPTAATAAFWRQMIRLWKNDPRVVFDLFNEPRKCTWAQWQAATQPLVTEIRAAHARNVIWVNGINWGSTLAGIPLLSQPAGNPPIVYTIHHPGSDRSGSQPAPSAAQLDAAFGGLPQRGIPVVNAEFTNFTGSYDWYDSARNVHRYFAFLTAHHVGMLAWSLVPGSLNSDLHYTSASREPQGDGQLVRAYFTHMEGRP